MLRRVVIVSVVRNQLMFQKCIETNPNCRDVEILKIDNTKENKGIPTCYNAFLNSFDYSKPAWILFCHEDFEIRESLQPLLKNINTSSIYGPCGACRYKWLNLFTRSKLTGQIYASPKDGSHECLIGQKAPNETLIDTLDCCAILIHSSLIKTYNLRFDEKLSFDLYAEDFSINAFLSKRIPTRILNIICCHHSMPTTLPTSYLNALSYINKKYAAFSFAGTCTCIGNCLLSKIYCTPLIHIKRFFDCYIRNKGI